MEPVPWTHLAIFFGVLLFFVVCLALAAKIVVEQNREATRRHKAMMERWSHPTWVTTSTTSEREQPSQAKP